MEQGLRLSVQAPPLRRDHPSFDAAARIKDLREHPHAHRHQTTSKALATQILDARAQSATQYQPTNQPTCHRLAKMSYTTTWNCPFCRIGRECPRHPRLQTTSHQPSNVGPPGYALANMSPASAAQISEPMPPAYAPKYPGSYALSARQRNADFANLSNNGDSLPAHPTPSEMAGRYPQHPQTSVASSWARIAALSPTRLRNGSNGARSAAGSSNFSSLGSLDRDNGLPAPVTADRQMQRQWERGRRTRCIVGWLCFALGISFIALMVFGAVAHAAMGEDGKW